MLGKAEMLLAEIAREAESHSRVAAYSKINELNVSKKPS